MIKLYKPNSRNTGSAFSFQLGVTGKEKEPCVYVNAVQQFSWNDKTKNGSFSENAKSPDKSVSIKLNEFELGGIMNAIEKNSEYKAFHSFDENKTSISFKPYQKNDGSMAFSFSIIKNTTMKFSIGIEISEATAIKEFLRFSLLSIFAFRQNARSSQ